MPGGNWLYSAVNRYRVAFLAALALGLVGIALSLRNCEKKTPPPSPPPSQSTPELPTPVIPPAPEPAESTATFTPVPENVAAKPKAWLKTKPDTLAFVGHLWSYAPKVATWPQVQIELKMGPPGMGLEDGQLRYLPKTPGRHNVRLQLHRVGKQGSDDSIASMPVAFYLSVATPLRMKVSGPEKPVFAGEPCSLIVHVDKAAHLPWPVEVQVYRRQTDKPDTVLAMTASDVRLIRAWPNTGKQTLEFVAVANGHREDSAQVAVTLLAKVGSTLQAPLDTLEPGGKAAFVIGGLQGNAPFTLSLDIDGDGKSDWQGQEPGTVLLPVNKSGHFAAALQVIDAQGLKGRSEAAYRVNQRTRVSLESKIPRANLVTPFRFRLEAEDSDDSLTKVTGHFPDTVASASIHATMLDTASPEKIDIAPGGHSLKAYWTRSWAKPGKYGVQACATSTDARRVCDQVEVEVFNAGPICKILPGLKPTPGVPIDIVGEAQDPDGRIVLWEWNLDGDPKFELQRKDGTPVHFTFARKGKFPVVLRVTTADGMVAQDSLKVEVKSSW